MPPAEGGVDNMRPDGSGSFDDYLQRAKSLSPDRINNDPNRREIEAGQAAAPQTESARAREEDPCPVEQAESPTAEESPGKVAQLSNQDNKLASNPETGESESQNLENKQGPRESGDALSQTEQGAKKERKSEHEGPDSSRKSENQENQPVVLVNPDAVQARSRFLSGADASATQAETKEATKSLPIVAEDATPIVGPDALMAMESLKTNKPLAAESAKEEAAISQSMKGKKSPKNALAVGKTAEQSPADKQTGETLLTAEGDNTPAVKKTAGIYNTSGRDALRKSSHQNEKKEPSSAEVAQSSASLPDARTSLPDAKQPVAGGAAIPPAALLAEVAPQTKPTKPAEAEVVTRTTKATAEENAEIAKNVASNLGPSASKAAPGASQSSGSERGSQLDRVRFVQRVERAFAAIGDRGGSLRLKLSPPELGSLHLEITVRRGEMKARIEAESKDAKNLLLENLPALRDRLAQQNIKIQKFDVDLRDPSLGGTPQQTGQQNETQSGGGRYRAQRPGDQENSETPVPEAALVRLGDHSGQLNVIV